MHTNTEEAGALRRRAAERLEEALGVLHSWVEVNSFTRHRGGIEENAARIVERFAALGFDESVVPGAGPEFGDHRVLTRTGGPRRVLLVSHLDTVYPPEEERRHDFHWKTDGEWIVGPGVADIKGGTLVIWMALSLLAELRPEVFEAASWTVLLNAREEEGSPEFPALARKVAVDPVPAEAALVFEHGTAGGAPGRSLVTHSRRGAGRFRVETHGRSSHSGSAHARGVNAIRQLARLVERIEAETDRERGLTFNVGLIRGGMTTNTVPEHAEAWIDMRADDPEAFDDGSRFVASLEGTGDVTAASDGAAARTTVERLPCYPPWPLNPGSERLARLAAEAGADLGLEIGSEHRLGASDGCLLWDLVPTLDGLGPIGRNIHCAIDDPARGRAPEAMRPDSIPDRSALLATMLHRLAVYSSAG